MGIFDLKRAKVEKAYPHWMVNDNERKVYDSVNNRIAEIERLIKLSREPLSARDKKIAKSVICIALGLSGSYIAKHLELNSYVDGNQRRINRHSEDLKTVKQQRESNQVRPEAMSKPQLVSEVKELRKQLKERESELYVDQIIHLLDAGLAENQVVIKNRIEDLETKLDLSIQQLARMNSVMMLLKREIVSAHRINKTMSESALSLLSSERNPENIAVLLSAVKKKSGK